MIIKKRIVIKKSRQVGPSDHLVDDKLPPKPIPCLYKLTDSMQAKVDRLADPKCHMCKGTGIKEWINNGACAKICKCVELAGVKESLLAKLSVCKKAAKEMAAPECILCKGEGFTIDPKEGVRCCTCLKNKDGEKVTIAIPEMTPDGKFKLPGGKTL